MKCGKRASRLFDIMLANDRDKGKGLNINLFSDSTEALGYNPIRKDFQVKMTPTDFLLNASRREEGLYNDVKAKDFYNNLGSSKVSPPILRLRAGDNRLQVVGHEGRHRSNLAKYVNGDSHIPVSIHIEGGAPEPMDVYLDLPIVSEDGKDIGRTLRDMHESRKLPLSSDINQNRDWEGRNNIKIGTGYGDHWVLNDDIFDSVRYTMGDTQSTKIHETQDVGMVNPKILAEKLGKGDTYKLLSGKRYDVKNVDTVRSYATEVSRVMGDLSADSYKRYNKLMDKVGYDKLRTPVLDNKELNELDITTIRREDFDKLYHQTSTQNTFELSDGIATERGNMYGRALYVKTSPRSFTQAHGTHIIESNGLTRLTVTDIPYKTYFKAYASLSEKKGIGKQEAMRLLNQKLKSSGIDAIKTETVGHKDMVVILNEEKIKDIGEGR